ncbi:MAG TPA: dethiobiotin synthase [Steroidobacteraceae bacterium]|jgi:dethiobiotin synthetase
MSAPARTTRPKRLIGIVGTNTEVGKTWVTSHLLRLLKSRGLSVAARKPVQSFDPPANGTDAELLAAATGENVEDVCPRHRWYPVAMAPPMAADVLGREPILLSELAREILWPADIDVGCVETVGGARAPLAHDADSVDILKHLAVDEVLLVADAGLGTLNAVRLTLECLKPLPVTVFLNRYDADNELHRLNRRWLLEKDGSRVLTAIQDLY